MKYLICALGLMSMVCLAGAAQAETASWVGNPEPDVAVYEIYGCDGAGCVVTPSPDMLKGTVPHRGAGVKHTFTIDVTGKEGALAILARDAAKNASGLSVSVGFDRAAPAIPAPPTLQ